MRAGTAIFTAAGVLAGLFVGVAPARAAASGLTAGRTMHVGDTIHSANGRYVAGVRAGGRLVVRTASTDRQLWATPSAGAHASLSLTEQGQLVLRSRAGAAVWTSRTRGSHAGRLWLADDGTLRLTAGRLPVWTNRVGSKCPHARGKAIVVDLGEQRARMCRSGQQLRTTLVTTGATALGYGTPTGTWHVYARVRDTTLYPAAGGAYPVHFWMPYSGPYGLHDSPWQHFPYGSPRYKTDGSHGCVHVPGRVMAWLFGWAPVGTRVTVHA